MSFHGGLGRGGGARRPAGPLPLVVSSHLLQKAPENLSQNMVDHFWSRFTAKNPGKATTLLPKNELAERLSKRRATKDLAGGGSKTTATSYEEAAAACRAKVAQIVLECRRVNQKYRDPHFDLDYDLKSANRYCLESLSNDAIDYRPPPDPGFSSRSGSSDESSSRQNRKRNHRRLAKDVGRGRSAYLLYGERNSDAKGKRSGKETKRAPGGYESSEDDDSQSPVLGRVGSNKLRGPPGAQFNPRSVKRVGDIFDDPKFYIEGPTANDIRQGADGDCWFMAALCTLTNKPGLVEKICVARDEIVGVYGFVFHRDGEWVSEIIDDKLYLKKPDYDERQSTERQRNLDRELWDEIDRQDPDEIYRKTYQANSTALYFAQCEHPNETWLPLLEKAYAKAHGDYAAIDGGFTGEGIEDLTGGVTSELFTTDILDREHFWNEELMKVNDEFLFGCSTGDWRGFGDRRGIKERHAYSVMRAVEIDGERLVLLKNPWGKGEWQGAWSDGSKEWTAEWLQKLDHKFGDDGAFWISYKDLLRKYQHFDRTRLFDDKWKVVSMWTTLNVSWAPDYHDTKFSFTLEKSGPVVIVLSQLDDRYFRGFEGAYTFGIGLRLHKAGEKDYLVRTQTTYRMTRSCNVELNLEAGEYTVLVKVDATRRDNKLAPEDVIRLNTKYRREKVLRIAMAYDLAHSKAQIVETPEEKEAREKHEKRQKDKYRKKMRKAVESERRKQYQQECRGLKMERKMRAHEHAWRKQHNEKREAKRKAAEEARQKEWEREQAERLAFAKNRQAAANGKDPAEKERRPGAEVKVGDVEAKAAEPDRAPEPEVSTDAGEHTPPTSTNSASERTAEKAAEGGNIVAAPTEEKTAEEKTPEKEISKEKASEEKASGEKLPEEEAVQKPTAEAKTSEEGPSGTQETVKPEDNQPEKVSEEEEAAGGTQTTFATAATELPASSDEPEHPPKIPAQDAAAPAPALFRDQSPHRGVELQQRIKRALNVVTNVERELHGLLQYTQGGPPSERDDGTASYDEEQEEEEQEQEQHSRHFHRPPHPHRLQQHVPGPHHRLADHNRYIPRSRDNSPQPPRRNNPPPPAPPSYMSGPPDPRFRPRQRPGFHMPPPPPPPFQPPFQDDSEPESIMPPCSPLEVSDTELDCMLKDNEQEVMRIINRGPPPAPHPSGMPPVMVTRGRSPPPPVGPYQARGGGRVMFGQDVDEPWNAVAVVGLRIYYKVDGGGGDGDGEGGGGDASKEGVKLRVVRPIYFDDSSSDDDDDDDDDDKDDHDKGKKKEKKEEEEEEERDGEKEVEETKVLDVDDSAKDAIEEVEGGAKE